MSVIGAHPRSVCRSPGVCAPAREGRGGNVCGAPPIVRPALLPRRPGVWAVRPSLTGHAAPATLPTSKRPPGCGRSARRVGLVALADNDRGGGHVTERHVVSLPRKGVLGLRFVHMLATVGGGWNRSRHAGDDDKRRGRPWPLERGLRRGGADGGGRRRRGLHPRRRGGLSPRCGLVRAPAGRRPALP